MVFKLIPYKKVARTIAKEGKSPWLFVVVESWLRTSKVIPQNPIIVPSSWYRLILLEKNKYPTSKVNIGVKLFMIPASPEEICVSA